MLADATQETASSCPPPADPNRCSGNDPGFVFSPPLYCDPSFGSEGGATDGGPPGNVAANDSGVDLCALVTTLSVYFTPNACRAFAGAEASGDVDTDAGPSVPVIGEPGNGAMLTPDEWSIFAWDPPPQRDARREQRGSVLDLFEPSAYAFSALQGDAYVLEFTQGCAEVMRVMLATTYWAPDPTSWAILSSLKGPVEVRVYWMRFAGDALVSKPVPSLPITITMQSTGGG
jgi:hypothetical protein